jgi:hypothetical protein
MKKLIPILILLAGSLGVGRADPIEISNGTGLTIDTFPASIPGGIFTDGMGNTVTAGSSFFVFGGAWFGAGDLSITLVNPTTAVGFTFLNLCGNCTPIDIPNFTLFDSVSLGNGESYNVPTGIAGGLGEPPSQFFGVSSTTPFTTATFHEHQFSSFGISDFRFAATPEPSTLSLVVPALLIMLGGFKRGIRRKQ